MKTDEILQWINQAMDKMGKYLRKWNFRFNKQTLPRLPLEHVQNPYPGKVKNVYSGMFTASETRILSNITDIVLLVNRRMVLGATFFR